MPRYFDTHSHLHFTQYDTDRSEVLERMRERGVWTIAVGTSYKTSEQAALLADMHESVWASIGVHPTDTHERFSADAYRKLLSEHVVAVGECGFDYFRTSREDEYTRQRENFKLQLQFAIEHDLPLMLHVRPSKDSTDAHDDALQLLTDAKRTHGERVRGNAHFFTSSLDVAQRYWELGFTIALPGVVTFAPELEALVRAAPLDKLLSETDAPYAAPKPYRGERNEPGYVVEVVERIAALRGESAEEVRAQLVANALRLFAIAQ